MASDPFSAVGGLSVVMVGVGGAVAAAGLKMWHALTKAYEVNRADRLASQEQLIAQAEGHRAELRELLQQSLERNQTQTDAMNRSSAVMETATSAILKRLDKS